MKHQEYVDLMAQWFSGDVAKVAEANNRLYNDLVDEKNDVMKKLAVSDIESRIDGIQT